MKSLSNEKLFYLYNCVLTTSKICEFPFLDIIQCFYCGIYKNTKFVGVDYLIIVVNEDKNNRFYDEMITLNGCYGFAKATKNSNKYYRFKVITDTLYKVSGSKVFENNNVSDTDPYKYGLSIIKDIKRLNKLNIIS